MQADSLLSEPPGKPMNTGDPPSPRDLPDPGIELGSPVLQEVSLPAELPGKPTYLLFNHSMKQRSIITKVLRF